MVEPYLSIEKAEEWLRMEGRLDDFPSEDYLEMLLNRISSYLDYWIGYPLRPTLYSEIKPTNGYGRIVLSHYPVLAIVKVNHLLASDVRQEQQYQEAKQLDPKQAGLDEFDRSKATAYRLGEFTVDTGVPYAWVEVFYWAGFSPLPIVVEECIFMALTHSLIHGGMANLFTPFRQVTSQSLPGGLSQSFKIPESKTGEVTFLDHYFAPLDRYKRKLYF